MEGLSKRDRLVYALKNNPPTLTGIVIGVAEAAIAWAVGEGHIDVELAGTLGVVVPVLANKFIAQHWTVSWERWSNEHLDHDGEDGEPPGATAEPR